MMKFLVAGLGGLIFMMVSPLSAAVLYPQCPPTGANTGCEFLLQIGASGGVTVLADPNAPNNGPYDGSDDTLIGVQNNSTATITSIPLSSSQSIFGFEGDGPCGQTPAPLACPSSAGFPGDSTGYGGPGVTYSGINSAQTAGTVNFSPGIAPGGSAWFGLEEQLAASQITPGTPNGGIPPPPSGVPEPSSLGLMGGGLGALLLAVGHRKI